jgi:Ca2+-binding RTX toxin-like protein
VNREVVLRLLLSNGQFQKYNREVAKSAQFGRARKRTKKMRTSSLLPHLAADRIIPDHATSTDTTDAASATAIAATVAGSIGTGTGW